MQQLHAGGEYESRKNWTEGITEHFSKNRNSGEERLTIPWEGWLHEDSSEKVVYFFWERGLHNRNENCGRWDKTSVGE